MPKVIEIKGTIIPSSHQWIYDLFGMEATSPRKVNTQLAEANGDEIEVLINSGGGSVPAGVEIYTSLKSYKGKSLSNIVGMAGSAASVAAMGTKETFISPAGLMMVHNSTTRGEGDHRAFSHTANVLQTVDNAISNAYLLKTGHNREHLLELMGEETWMDAQQALANKFVDGIMFNEDDRLGIVANASSEIIPMKVIDKIRAEISKIQNQSIEGGISVEGQNTQNPVVNQTSVQNPAPPAAQQQPVTQPAVTAVSQQSAVASNIDVVAQERARLKAIDEISANIDPALVNEAKYGDMPMSAEQLAFRAMKEGKMLNNGIFEQSVQANAAAGVNDVVPQPVQQNNEGELDLSNLGDVNKVFNMFAQNALADRRQNVVRG